jgi:Tfp pilus assembly protein PilX
MNRLSHRQGGLRHQHGVASLVVVSVLLFIMLLVAAYANRSLISELKTSANQYRVTQTGEAAEAAAEWALAMLNTGRITASCTPSTSSADSTFRERALRTHLTGPAFTYAGVPAACVKDDTSWTCSCPTTGMPALTAPAGSSTAPAFTVDFGASQGSNASRQSIQITVLACSAMDANSVCLATPVSGEAVSRVGMDAALVPALATVPLATITSTGTVDLASGSISVRNTDAAAGGVTVNAAQVVPGVSSRLSTVAGSPSSIVEDPGLPLSPRHDLLFPSTFGMPPSAFKSLPTVVKVNCVNDCAANLTAAFAKGTRMAWVEGDLTLADVSLGSVSAPVLLVVSGDIHITGTAQINGLVWGRSLRWDGSGAGYVRGALVTPGDVGGAGSAEFIYDGSVLSALNQTTGTFVRVPGSWRDFK